MDARLAWVWLSLACGAGSRVPLGLLHRFETPENILKADRKEIADVLSSSEMKVLSRLCDRDLSDAAEIIYRCDEAGVRILTPMDEAYPRTLYQLRDAPCVLYAVGHLPDFEKNCCCAVVGTRKMSDYGKQMAYDIGRGIGAGGAVLVSGLALGVDGMAMAGALSAGGVTVGVLGCGIDIVYPQEHRDLMKRVFQNGAVITEYPLGTPPAGRNFPVRNRIISGLSDAVVVVEGDLRSGALITARHALYQGRDQYAVPGMVGESGAAGPNLLIKTGACAITSAIDVLKNYEFIYPHSIRMAAAEKELACKVLPDAVKDVATRMHVTAVADKKYYGNGNYGGKRDPLKKPPKTGAKHQGEGKLTPKTMLARFETHKGTPPKNMILSSAVDFDMLDDNAKLVYASMSPNVPMVLDDICVGKLTAADVLGALTLLELCGAVECTAGSFYIRRGDDEPTVLVPDAE